MLALVPLAGPFLALVGGVIATFLLVPFSPFWHYSAVSWAMFPNQALLGALILVVSF
ncbi:MAG TPA: hypothetical protein VEG44_00185 [Candidatus Acidoferrales bacterium]|nr:hypothetical protein [Candidatus Acidoferrales bacterium]